MADGDEIHVNLPGRYINSYKDICVESPDLEDVAHQIARAVCKDVKKFGNAPIRFISTCVKGLFQQLAEEPLLRSTVDYGALHYEVDHLTRRHFGNELGMDLAKRAVRQAIEAYRRGEQRYSLEDVLKKYLMNIHKARFSECVPLTETHLNQVSAEIMHERLNDLIPSSDLEYEHIAKALARNPNVDQTLRRRPLLPKLGLHDEIQ